MKSKSLVMLFVSLGFGLIAAIGISQVMGRNKGTGEAAVQMVPVVVARTAINHESKFDETTVGVDEWPVNLVPEGALSSLDQLENMVIATPLTRGLPILETNLVESSKVVSVPIPPGKKVMGLPLDAEDHMNGLLRPGDRVDIVGVFKDTVNNQEVSSPRTFMKNIKIFSVGDSFKRDLTMEKSGGSGKVNVGVLVNEKESEILALALGSNTKLKFLMRADTGSEEVEIVDDPYIKRLLDKSREAEAEVLDQGKSDEGMLANLINQAIENSAAHQMVIWQGSEPEIIRFDSKGQRIQPPQGPSFQGGGATAPGGYPMMFPAGGFPGGFPGNVPGGYGPNGPTEPVGESNGSAGPQEGPGSNKGFEEDQYPEG